jgi:para-aminobenzoate synthetase / 4-amino-4-deoxychorismate lyase
VLSEPSEEFVARQHREVEGVLQAAESAARHGRWVAGFVTYEAAPGLDPSLPSVDWPDGHPLSTLPLAWFAAFDRRDEVEPYRPGGPEEVAESHRPRRRDGEGTAWSLDRDQAWHRQAVATVQDAIAAGDYYQLNLTARLTGNVADASQFYGPLAAAQAGRYNALITTPDHTVISASPELFFTRDGDVVVTRPMKGTAARGRWPEEDRQRAETLQSSPKERAENVMIVDLLRNDLGRLAEVGTVEVPSLFEAERFPTVWQLTSTITARIDPDIDLGRLFAALFPSGSVTGAPKRAAMRAIAQIEQRPRGVYCGAVGYLQPGSTHPGRAVPAAATGGPGRAAGGSRAADGGRGPADPEGAAVARFSVAIRTITRDNRSGYGEYGSGGAITSLSDPDAEWAELLTKTAVLHRPPRPGELIETLRYEPPGTLVNLERHLARLRASAGYFAFDYDSRSVDSALAASLADRTVVTRVRIRLEPWGRVHVDVGDLLPVPAVVRLARADEPVCSDDVLLFHKQVDRRRYDRLRQARPDVDDVVLWNEAGQVTETTIANLAVEIGGRWWTPRLSCGLLPGIERGRLLDTGVLEERTVTVDDLAQATSVAVISSLRGWRPAELRV